VSHKQAKRIRTAILPNRVDCGMSRGRFTRGLTRYKRHIHKRVLVSWVLESLFGKIPFEYYTDTVDPDCPRGTINKLTRIINDRRRSQRIRTA
jgi:hypothetical protein